MLDFGIPPVAVAIDIVRKVVPQFKSITLYSFWKDTSICGRDEPESNQNHSCESDEATTSTTIVTAPVTPEEARKLKRRRKVSFSDLEIRTYPTILGDHPECEFGPPLTIDWEPLSTNRTSLDEYEASREPRRDLIDLKLPSYKRKRLLREHWGVTNLEMVRSSQEARRIQKLRRITTNLLVFSFLEEGIEDCQDSIREFIDWTLMSSWLIYNFGSKIFSKKICR